MARRIEATLVGYKEAKRRFRTTEVTIRDLELAFPDGKHETIPEVKAAGAKNRATDLFRSFPLMYAYIVTRTQIYLSEVETKALEREARASGRSKSQLIREAIDRVYLQANDSSTLTRALATSAGAWKRRASGESYVERVRGGRLPKLHGPASE